MHHPTDRIAHTTAFVTPVVEHGLEREILLKQICSSSVLFTERVNSGSGDGSVQTHTGRRVGYPKGRVRVYVHAA